MRCIRGTARVRVLTIAETRSVDQIPAWGAVISLETRVKRIACGKMAIIDVK
jgi:hypothetical protein